MLDLINAVFEVSGGAFVFLNVLQILKDKQIKGVSIVAVGFFTFWGAWNLIYYYGIGQIWSWFGALSTFLVNCLWIGLMVYYARRSSAVLPDEHETHLGV